MKFVLHVYCTSPALRFRSAARNAGSRIARVDARRETDKSRVPVRVVLLCAFISNPPIDAPIVQMAGLEKPSRNE
ncbi:hypothetical protein [Paraburkholderia susongensis]|uniref:hypothetical protein n=1 Tax=Paraburkholderia susongensis TaxID=1515439 RepID=UPI00117EA316|nr:hypothetical protein [Paraburkholderia susongensis]